MAEELDDCKTRIINTIAKLDNGSHSSSQLQAVDEYLAGVFNDAVRSARLAGFDEAVRVVNKTYEYAMKAYPMVRDLHEKRRELEQEGT